MKIFGRQTGNVNNYCTIGKILRGQDSLNGGGGKGPPVPPKCNTAHSKVHSHSVDPQKNCCNYLITWLILKFPTPRRPSLQCRSFDMHISVVGRMNKS